MAAEVKLPQLGQGMESGTIVRWLKAEGDPVRKNEPLYELDTDKVTQEVESDVDGVLLEIVVREGEVQVGSTIAMIEPAGGAAVGEAPPAAEAPPAEAKAAPTSSGNGDAGAAVAIPAGGSHASAASIWRRLPGPGPTVASSPKTSSRLPSEVHPPPPACRCR